MYGVSEGPDQGWARPEVLATIAAGLVLLAAMVAVELRSPAPMVDLRLLGNRLFRAGNGVMVLASVAFLGTLYVISLYFQDGRGLDALGSGLSTFPEALGVMGGAQLASRLLYPRLGPRRHITIGLIGTATSIGLLALLGPSRSLWWARLLMLTLGLSMAQVFVPVQAAAFATITPAATGRAATMFNAIRQLGGAIGVALLTSVIVAVGPVRRGGRPPGRQPDRLPGRLPGRRGHLPVRGGLLAVHPRRRRRQHHPRPQAPFGATGTENHGPFGQDFLAERTVVLAERAPATLGVRVASRPAQGPLSRPVRPRPAGRPAPAPARAPRRGPGAAAPRPPRPPPRPGRTRSRRPGGSPR